MRAIKTKFKGAPFFNICRDNMGSGESQKIATSGYTNWGEGLRI